MKNDVSSQVVLSLKQYSTDRALRARCFFDLWRCHVFVAPRKHEGEEASVCFDAGRSLFSILRYRQAQVRVKLLGRAYHTYVRVRTPIAGPWCQITYQYMVWACRVMQRAVPVTDFGSYIARGAASIRAGAFSGAESGESLLTWHLGHQFDQHQSTDTSTSTPQNVYFMSSTHNVARPAPTKTANARFYMYLSGSIVLGRCAFLTSGNPNGVSQRAHDNRVKPLSLPGVLYAGRNSRF